MTAEDELIQLRQENANLREQVQRLAQLEETIQQLSEQVQRLQEQLGKDGHNSHLPPSLRKQGWPLLAALQQVLAGHPLLPALTSRLE